LDGQYVETIFLPGAYVCRPVFKGDELYAGVCWSRLRYMNQTDNSGFVTILDKNNKVISNPGGTKPVYKSGELQMMVQESPLFKHCHDVCIDSDDNIYVCQWNAGKTYPIKLERV
ncbi:MAG: 6-bladed beta-propeller, partial [Cyclobacteriaceae bacterium]|nr:6-bladed beta-propeller [Cyclobacteriaceae bacterium]